MLETLLETSVTWKRPTPFSYFTRNKTEGLVRMTSPPAILSKQTSVRKWLAAAPYVRAGVTNVRGLRQGPEAPPVLGGGP
ncbi:jg19095 [Pararge aegeria aegeria]|uniref:Jg19095 protein n=1 Tax=Pararge aegeria aegeria TaxID=348720 RepID=A0A8S4SNR9_9NEOP|nr:jg19095 [Pararge aegeria aegeria]